MKEKFLHNNLIGKALIAIALSFFVSQTTSAQCMADGASIEITGGGTSTTICAGDGMADSIAVTNVGVSSGTSSGWVITDNATGVILGLPPGPPFDLEGAGGGVCDIWYIRYESDLMGLSVDANVADLTGCFDFSNAISVTRNGVDGAEIEITGGGTATTICAGDGAADPIEVTNVGSPAGTNAAWVITDNATGTILGLPPGPPFDLEGAGGGVCDIWYLRYETGLTGLTAGSNVADLSGCFDFSNAISVTRNGVDGAAIEITGGGTAATICAGDGAADPIEVTNVGSPAGTNAAWVITDNATGTILGLPPGPPFDLEGAGGGVCDIWYLRYETGLTGLTAGSNVADLSGCFDFSNAITVNREGVLAPPIFVTGSQGNTEVTICAGDGIDNFIGATVDGDGIGDNSGWLITDAASGEILALPAAPPFNLDGAGTGVCEIWYIRYANGLAGLEAGQNVADLDGCFDLSNPITVTRLGVDGAAIEITGGGTNVDICAGDGIDDPIEVSIVGAGVGENNGWVITDNATGTILGLPSGPPFNLEGAGGGVCDIWYIRYNGGLSGLAVGEDVADLTGCFDLSNAITVNREGVDGSEIQLVGTGGDEISICAGDGVDDFIDVELLVPGVGDNGAWVITDNATGVILGLPAAPPFNLEGAGAGVCDVWYIRYADGLTGLDVGQNVVDLDGCFDFSNPVTVTRLTGADCDILSVGDVTSDFEFSLFPNPASSVITLAYNGNLSTVVAATIYDMSGRIVTQTSFETQENTTLDVSELSIGTYLITMENIESGATTTKRLIKQ